jgi:hypothetical protein
MAGWGLYYVREYGIVVLVLQCLKTGGKGFAGKRMDTRRKWHEI